MVGLIKLTKILLPKIQNQIINIGSKYAYEGCADYTTYCASKWGLRGFTQSLAKEVKNLRILTVHPGPTKTNIYGDWKGGINPDIVAKEIYKIVNNTKDYDSGDDINLFEYLK